MVVVGSRENEGVLSDPPRPTIDCAEPRPFRTSLYVSSEHAGVGFIYVLSIIYSESASSAGGQARRFGGDQLHENGHTLAAVILASPQQAVWQAGRDA